MKTIAALSLFSLVSAAALTVAPGSAHAQQLALAAPYQEQAPILPPAPYQEPVPSNQAVDAGVAPGDQIYPTQLPEPYQPPQEPYETEADAAQVDWPQDVVPEETAVDSYDDGYDPQAYAQFQDELSPYGDWVDDGTYGRIWVPSTTLVGADFTPYYTGGHWVLTEFGWTWVSDWSWGWAPFHYGRWIACGGRGWCWVPGRLWGPAWVSWRSGGGWVGWAALPPRGVSVAATYGHMSPWRFSRQSDLGASRPRCVPMRDMRGMFHRTTLVTNDRVLTRGAATVHINAGPRFVPNATPQRLMAVAPQAFPQRRILPQRGVNMSDRPWIRAATGGGGVVPAAGGPGVHGGGFGGGRVSGHDVPAGARWSSTPAPRIYNPPRAFASTVAPHTFSPAAPAPAMAQPRAHDPAPVYGSAHTYSAPVSAAPHGYGAGPHMYGAPPARNVPQVYSPPSRPFAQPAAPVQRAPAQPFRQTYAPNPAPAPHFSQPHNFSPPVAQPRSFSAPAPSFGGGGFGHAGGGGGAHFGGGGHRR